MMQVPDLKVGNDTITSGAGRIGVFTEVTTHRTCVRVGLAGTTDGVVVAGSVSLECLEQPPPQAIHVTSSVMPSRDSSSSLGTSLMPGTALSIKPITHDGPDKI